MRFCGLAVNLLDQVYYPLEHVAWAADCKLLKIKSDPWWTASTICWALSMYFMIFKYVHNISFSYFVYYFLNYLYLTKLKFYLGPLDILCF